MRICTCGRMSFMTFLNGKDKPTTPICIWMRLSRVLTCSKRCVVNDKLCRSESPTLSVIGSARRFRCKRAKGFGTAYAVLPEIQKTDFIVQSPLKEHHQALDDMKRWNEIAVLGSLCSQ